MLQCAIIPVVNLGISVLAVSVSIPNNEIHIFMVITLLVTLYMTSLRLIDHLW